LPLSSRSDDFLKAALDEEERPRIEVEDGSTLHHRRPAGHRPAMARSMLYHGSVGDRAHPWLGSTVGLRADTILQDFIQDGYVASSPTSAPLCSNPARSATRYLQYLRSIDQGEPPDRAGTARAR